MKRAIIVGASSGIGAELARQLAAKSYQVALLARSEDKIQALAEELRNQYGPLAAHAWRHDVLETEAVQGLFDAIVEKFGTVDTVVYCSGAMIDTAADEFPVDGDLHVLDVNLRGAFVWLDHAAAFLLKKGSGTIVAISSVAGDRGRKPNPSYQAAKAGLSTFAESLWMRLSDKGVNVVTIKPGPIETPMVAGRSSGKPYPLKPAVTEMIAAIEGGKRVAYVPGKWRWIMLVIMHLPAFVLRKLGI